MKALALAALLILGSTASATPQSKWQALIKKYGPGDTMVDFDGAIEKAKLLCLCHEDSPLNQLGVFISHYDGGLDSRAVGRCAVPISFNADGTNNSILICNVFDVLGR
jgi:hypothetical protein